MTSNKTLACLAILLALASGLCEAQTPAPAPSFTISANAITMPSSGSGNIPFTLTSVNGFAGNVAIMCENPNPPAGVNEPNCGNYGFATPPIVLAANAKATGVVYITAAQPLPVHQVSRLDLPKDGKRTSWAAAGLLMLGLGLRKRKTLRRTRLLLALGMLIGLTGMSGCGGGIATLTPGTYVYTLTAYTPGESSTPISVSTTITVTVPPGIAVQPTIGPGPV